MVTSVRVREVMETVGSVVTNLALAIRGASAVTLISAILVLGGALAAGHRHRVYDAVILKTLGATRLRLLGAYALEYLLIGLATAVFGVIAGSVAAWMIVTRLMTLTFVWQAGSAAGVVAAALVVTVGLGLAGHAAGVEQKARHGVAEFVTNGSGRLRGSRNRTIPAINHVCSPGLRARATFSRAWTVAANVLVSHISSGFGAPIMSQNLVGRRSVSEIEFDEPAAWRPSCRTGPTNGNSTMSDLDRNYASPFGRAAGRVDAATVDAGLRAYMLRIYNYMSIGLAITGLAALGVYMAAVTDVPTPEAVRVGKLFLTPFGYAMFVSPLKWLFMLAPLAMVFVISAGINRLAPSTAQILFWVFAALMGISLSSIFLVFTHTSIVRVFFITAATFGALSLYGYTTKRD